VKGFTVDVRLGGSHPTSAEERRSFEDEAGRRVPSARVEWSSDSRTVTVRMEREGPDADSVCQAAVAMVRGWAEGYAKIGPEAQLTITCQANEVG
jgi:hypothetical protein